MEIEGTKESKELLKLMCVLGNAFGKALEDGDLSWTDAAFAMDVFIAAPAALEGAGKIPAEASDYSLEEIEEMKAFAIQEFDIPQDKVEEIVEKGLKVGVALYDFILDFKTLFPSTEE